MFDHDWMFTILGLMVVGAPALLVFVLGLCSVVGKQPSERVTGLLVQTTIGAGLIASLVVLALMLRWGPRHVVVPLGEWVHIHHYHFVISFVFDRLSVPLVILSFLLCGTIGAFANRYMHREQGFSRFFVLYAFFVLGMVIASLAGTIETLFVGWELVGLSSAFLVAFYQERSGPVRNGFHIWVVYRISDAALLVASVVMHHLKGQGDFAQFLGSHGWPQGSPDITQGQALLVGLLLLLAAAGKSGLVPFSGWLPRAMEGPTPSSAVFYGALSVHLGAFLLLRFSPLLDMSVWLCLAIVAAGLATALFASFAGRVQTDIKSALSFASLTQVGIIVAEIGLGYWFNGFRYIALVHLLGHACFRTLQFVRAPSVLHDYSTIENAIGNRLPRLTGMESGFLPAGVQTWLYRFALEKGYLDAWLTDYLVMPLVMVLRWCDSMERRWTDFLSGTSSHESDRAKSTSSSLEELV
jgi:NAD(P)H-quinone oxidoreductase subunit 5